MKLGIHKKTIIALWLVLIGSVSFGIYKNFTAIDIQIVYEIAQTIKDGDQTKDNTAFYTVKVHANSNGYIITQNPTLTSTMKKSSYEPKIKEADASVDTVITQVATAFLETFFKLYRSYLIT